MTGSIQELTTENFEQEVLHSTTPVVVDFWATWCVPCKKMAPIIEEIGKKYKGKCRVLKLNIDDALEVATEFRVMNIPTIMFFKNGKEFTRITGVVTKDNLIEKIEEMLVRT